MFVERKWNIYIFIVLVSLQSVQSQGTSVPFGVKKCILPPYPAHGRYVTNAQKSMPGDSHRYIELNVTCDRNYDVDARGNAVHCYNGWWSDPLPKCILKENAIENVLPSDVNTPSTEDRDTVRKTCILPPYPTHGSYTANIPNAKPGDTYDIFSLQVTCREGYVEDGPSFIFCSGGVWSSKLPQCIVQCRLVPHPSIEYHCLVSLGLSDGSRPCNMYEPSGTLVSPVCRPHYYSISALKYMLCIDGEWNNVPTCIPECGTLIPEGTQLIIGGTTAKVGEVPWHAAIYMKTTTPYKYICGGSLISTNLVISAAHCFWSNSLIGSKLPASDFAVALGKLYRRADNEEDQAQWSGVESINLASRFVGSATNYQDDIAVLVLSTEVEYQTHIRPICVDFDPNFERLQLQPKNKGKVAGWGLITEDGAAAKELKVVDLPYVPVETCLEMSPPSFTPFITSDKICAGYHNVGTALCRGDSGGGLAFLSVERETSRYFLRGVVSTAPTNDNECDANSYTTFTRVIKHDDLIKQFWSW